MNISQEGISLIKKFEGCELEAYKCAAGVWTIGYGHTKDVKEGDSILKEDAESMLVHELQEYCNDVDIAVKVDFKTK
jgi:lysozyme